VTSNIRLAREDSQGAREDFTGITAFPAFGCGIGREEDL